MSFDGSQLPAEQRVDQLMTRLDGLANQEAILNSPEFAGAVDPTTTDPKAFRAMVSMMQSQMMGESLVNPDDKDSKNPINSLFAMNPQMGMMGMGSSQVNPQVMARLMQAGMMGGNMPMSMMQGQMVNPMMGQINPYAQMQEPMVFPLKGKISSDYGERSHPIHGHQHFHTGVDIAAEKGSAIRMPWQGKVVYVGEVKGFGENTVIVAHENNIQSDGKILYSVFGHNEHVFVKAGEQINQGDIFATVGDAGHATGPHLHWETRIAPYGLKGTEVFEREISMTIDPLSLA